MKKDSIMEVLGPMLLILGIASIIIWVVGHAVGITPEFLRPLSLWLDKPVAEVKMDQLLVAMILVAAIFGRG